MQTRPIDRMGRSIALACVLAGLLYIVLARGQTAQAAGELSDCTSTGLETALSGGSGSITFNCNGVHAPASITITHNGGLNIAARKIFSIDGGNIITLTGAHTHRVFDVRVGGALTLTNISLIDGQAFLGGNLPDLGGAILGEGVSLTLDHVTIRNSKSQTVGGAPEIITGTVLIQNSLIEGNQSDSGGGIDSVGSLVLSSRLTLFNSTIRDNYATGNNGGGLALGGSALI